MPLDAGNNFQVRTGAGTLLVAGVDYTVTVVGGQAVVELIDGASTGKLGKGRNADGSTVTNGSNVLVITYDIVADNGSDHRRRGRQRDFVAGCRELFVTQWRHRFHHHG